METKKRPEDTEARALGTLYKFNHRELGRKKETGVMIDDRRLMIGERGCQAWKAWEWWGSSKMAPRTPDSIFNQQFSIINHQSLESPVPLQ
jgi:hypothetical protein